MYNKHLRTDYEVRKKGVLIQLLKNTQEIQSFLDTSKNDILQKVSQR